MTVWTTGAEKAGRMDLSKESSMLPPSGPKMVGRTAFPLAEHSWMVSWTVPVTDMVILLVRSVPDWAVLSR